MALPGGIIYVSSGLVEATQNEPQLASVLAHQIGHVAARHGSQQVSAEYSRLHARQARPTVNDAISRLRLTMDPDSLVTRYDSQAEQQADIIATQMLYDARFDPRQIPTAFQDLDQRDNSSRDFVFNHPTQPNRTAVIRRELPRLGPMPGSWRGDSAAFRTAQQSLRNETSFGLASRIDDGWIPAPSTRWTTYAGVDFSIQYPDNWIIDEGGSSLIVAPDGGNVSGGLAYGMLINTFQPESRSTVFGRNDFALPGQSPLLNTSVSNATDQLIDELRLSNPNIRAGRQTFKRVDGFEAVAVELTNTSPLGGTEVDYLTAVLHSNGQLYYFLGVSRQSDTNVYSPVFDRMITSIRFY
jgi:predicted Zn-dependent protease